MEIAFMQHGPDVHVTIDGMLRGILRGVTMTIDNTQNITAFLEEYGGQMEAVPVDA